MDQEAHNFCIEENVSLLHPGPQAHCGLEQRRPSHAVHASLRVRKCRSVDQDAQNYFTEKM